MDHPILHIKDLSHWFGSNNVLHNINIDIMPGQFTALVGASGCGKSTLLKAIVGTHPPKSGRVTAYFDGQQSFDVLSPNRNIGIVYQHYSLYEFLTAKKNVLRGPDWDQFTIPKRMHILKYLRWRREWLRKAEDILGKVGLSEHINKYPKQLSGGQQQRVAVAQALIMSPKILLLDEPFGALDEAMREELQLMLLDLYQENTEAKSIGRIPPHTVIIVTHELNEALIVGTRIIGLSRKWGWKDTCPGATVVYDKPSPLVKSSDVRKFGCGSFHESFAKQKEEIREAIS